MMKAKEYRQISDGFSKKKEDEALVEVLVAVESEILGECEKGNYSCTIDNRLWISELFKNNLKRRFIKEMKKLGFKVKYRVSSCSFDCTYVQWFDIYW